MLAGNLMFPKHLWQARQVLVGEARTALRNRCEGVSFLVVGSQKQRAVRSSAFSPAIESAYHHEVHRVLHLATVISLVLYPQPASRSCLINRIIADCFADDAFATVRDGFLEELLKLLHLAGYDAFGNA